MHENHRERLRLKLLQNADLLEEHELLEILFFYAIPRKNTNPIAHKLIDHFGNLENVLNAEASQLMTIEGVGESVASYLKTLGAVLVRSFAKDDLPEIFSYDQIKKPIIKLFERCKSEVFVAFFLDKKQKIIGKKVISDHKLSSVEIDIAELTKQVLALKPAYVVISHNHLSGICTPTPNDDIATEKIMLMLKLYNVSLVDHLIVTSNQVFSYYYENRIDDIRNKVDSLI